MDIQDLKKSVTEMSDEELMNAMKEVRLSRRVVKRAAPTTTTEKKPKAGSKLTEEKASLEDIIKNLTPEQIAGILAKKGGK